MWSRDHTWSSTSAVSSTPSKGRLREQFVSFVSAQHSLDKPARLTIRVLWFLFLIVKSEVKKQIGRRLHCLHHHHDQIIKVTDRTTKLLLAVLIFFVFAELPQVLSCLTIRF